MKTWLYPAVLIVAVTVASPSLNSAGAVPPLEVGIKAVDVTPEGPIWLAGYAVRKRPSEKVDSPLLASAIAFKDDAGERFVLVALDNCEVSHAFITPVIAEANAKYQMKPGGVIIVSSHTHSAPVLENTLISMYSLPPLDAERVTEYSRVLRAKLIEVIGGALADLKPALLEQGFGRATFAMNRRVYQGDKVNFGENPDGPVTWDVPVLKVSGTNGALRAIVFGYACHGTSISGDDWYIVSGDYMAYARQHLEANFPGSTALYLTGMGADSNPSPRGTLLDAKRHGLELAGSVVGVLSHPMRPVNGRLNLAYEEADLPLEAAPSREKLESDSRSTDVYIRNRAEAYLKQMNENKPPATSVKLPLAAVRIGRDLTFVTMGGEVVVDYGNKFNRMFAADHPWVVGYAYEVPCYIPSTRILKEGGYEADSSLIYYGIYGPFRPEIEGILVRKMSELVDRVRNSASDH